MLGWRSGPYKRSMSGLFITAMAIEVGALAAAIFAALQSTAVAVRR